MAEISTRVYQTGQTVPASGMYEVVGTMQTGQTYNVLRNLQEGEVFPCHEGWEVCWYFQSAPHRQKMVNGADITLLAFSDRKEGVPN